MAGKKKEVNQVSALEPVIKWKGSKEFRHDRFELKTSKCKNNMSFTKFEPNIVEKDHKHWFHSHNQKGKEMIYCTPMSGHFHEVTTSVDSEGNLVATCGPALKKYKKKMRNGIVKEQIGPVQFKTQDPDHPIVDAHTHDIVYDESEMLSEKYKQARISADSAKLAALQGTRMQSLSPSQVERESQAQSQADKYASMQSSGNSASFGDTQISGLE